MFRIQGKYFFLTYPKANFNIDDYTAEYCSKGGIESIITASETHEDGSLHRHVAIAYETRKDIRSENYFDYQEFHPNIQSARSWSNVCDYVTKDGDYCTWPEDLEWNKTPQPNSKATDFQTESEWLEHALKSRIPYGYANRMWILSRKDHGDTIFDESAGTICQELLDYDFTEDSWSTVIVGKTGIGKTAWAINKAPKPALLVTHMDSLRQFDPEFHRSIIFDDMDFEHLPVTAQIHLVDHELPRKIHARYNCASIPAKTYKFFTCNKFPFSNHEAIERRIEHINI
jgi:hypothetical protein